MKSTQLPFARTERLILVAGLLAVVSVMDPSFADGQVTDSSLNVTITPADQQVVLSWFGSNAMAYQVESCSSLGGWTNLNLAIFGGDAMISVTNPATGEGNHFFRVRRMDPGASTATFTPGAGLLLITGDGSDNVIGVSRDSIGNLLVNNGSIPITGGVPTVTNTTLILILGRNGHDLLFLDEANGPLPAAQLFGEAGNDTLIGGSGADTLVGGIGLDTLFGMGGADSLQGGDDSDAVTGGEGNDVAELGPGDDRFIWNPGDGTDVVDGTNGVDTVEINGGNEAEAFTVTANGIRVRFDRLNPAPFFLDIGSCEKLELKANGGNDSFSCTGNLAALIQITADGGPGDDTLLGSNGADLLFGGDDNDFIDGQQGNDFAFLGAGNDVFQWDPGDGSDTIEGQDGSDTLLFNGSAGSEVFEASANGTRVRFTRNLGSVVMDLDDVEYLDVNALSSTDSFTVNDLTGTDLTHINIDLALSIGGGAGDGAADNIFVNGTSSDDVVTLTLPNGQLLVSGLSANVLVEHFDTTLDSVHVLGLTGDDILDATAVAVGGPVLALDGGIGNDILLGGAGNDTLTGGENDDVLLGSGGIDVLDGGLGDNVVSQDGGLNATSGIATIFGDDLGNTITISRGVGDTILSNGVAIPGFTIINTVAIRVFGRGGNDTITFDESGGALPVGLLFGGSGNNTLTGGSASDFLFGGSNNDTLLGKGGLDLLFGGAGDDTLLGGDADDQLFGGADNDHMVWNPGDDTDLNEGGPGMDTTEVNGGNGAEIFTVTANGTRVRFDRVTPAPFSIDIGTTENLLLYANGGNDSFSCTGNLAALIKITADGGPGEDTLLGSNGNDVLSGGDDNDFIDGNQGSDTAYLGAGNDTYQWDPGDGVDTVEGQDGFDTLLFNGSAGSEIFEASANGTRARFTRNLGNVVTDLDGIENLVLNALGGIDSFTVNDLTGTALTNVSVSLASGGAGDGAVDNIILNGTGTNDVVSLSATGAVVRAVGFYATVNISGSEPANDRITLNTLGGDDSVDASELPAGLIALTADGGIDHDLLIGSDGADTLLGGDGDDVLIGGPGVDILDGGPGNNILIPD